MAPEDEAMPCAFQGQLAEDHAAYCVPAPLAPVALGCTCEVYCPEVIMPGEAVETLPPLSQPSPETQPPGTPVGPTHGAEETRPIQRQAMWVLPAGPGAILLLPTEPEPNKVVLSQHKSPSVCDTMKANRNTSFFASSGNHLFLHE